MPSLAYHDVMQVLEQCALHELAPAHSAQLCWHEGMPWRVASAAYPSQGHV